MRRLRPLSETECYLRCYGWRDGDDSVRVLSVREPVAARVMPSVTAERIRLALEAMIDAREPEAA
jgi:hypothetical protein